VLDVALAELRPDVSNSPDAGVVIHKPPIPESLHAMLEETERTQILHALQQANGVVAGTNGAAARLGLKRSTLQLRMQKLGIRLSRSAIDDRGRTPT
jgi:formate hydrogenlyase transcriptional activator